jgi:hypothetical protein
VRRTWSIAVIAAVAAGLVGVPAASAGTGDRPDSLNAAKQAGVAPSDKWLRERLGSASDEDWFHFSMPSAGRALVTLGHLPRNYDLALYAGDGSRLGLARHSGRRFEQLYKPLPAGDVFARVTARSDVKPNARYALKFRPLDNDMVFAEQRNVGDTAGYDIKGELLNNTAQWRDVQAIHVTWTNSSGSSVGSQDVGIIPGPVAPRKRVQFSIEQTNPPAGTTGYRLSVTTRTTTRRTPQNLLMTPGTHKQTTTQRIYHGTITNTTSSTVRGLYPTVIEYDSLGRAIAFGFDKINSLDPGETVNYTAAINLDNLPHLNSFRSFYCVTKP